MSRTARLQGLFVPNIVPLDAHGEINEARLRQYVDWLIARGVHGLYPNGSTGEFTRFTAEERRRIIQIVCDQTAGRVPVLAGAAEANTRETIKACEAYFEMGARAVAIVAPFYFKLAPASVYAYFKEIADNSPIDITLYNIPMFASPIDVPTVQRLANECPKVVAIKDSSGDIPHMIRMIQAVRPQRADFSFLTGWEAALMPMLLVGADGGTNATTGVVPELMVKLYEFTQAGQIKEARELQYQLLTLFDLMLYTGDFPEGFRAALKLRGFDMGRGRQPVPPQHELDLQHVSRLMSCLLNEHGISDVPAAGCPPRVADVNIEQVSRIVSDVLLELKRRGLG